MPGGDVIGKTLMFGDPTTHQAMTIVGVTADFPTSQMSSTREQLLLPLAQHPGGTWPAIDGGSICLWQTLTCRRSTAN